MTTLYKLTDQNHKTRNGTKWGRNVTHKAEGRAGQALCSDGYIHAYEHPLIAVFMNPHHAAFKKPVMWEAKGLVAERDGQLKCGCRSLTTTRKIPIPVITTNQRVAFAILCALAAGGKRDKKFFAWATKWLSGEDRSAASSYAASSAAHAAKAAASYASASDASASAADAAAAAASAAYAAYAAHAAASVNLFAIAERAMTYD